MHNRQPKKQSRLFCFIFSPAFESRATLRWMMGTKTREVTVTIPEYLYQASLRMTSLGLFHDFSELVNAGIRRELEAAQRLLDMQPVIWQTGVEKLREKIQQERLQSGQPPLSEEEVIAQLRTIRREIWEHDYKPLYTAGTR